MSDDARCDGNVVEAVYDRGDEANEKEGGGRELSEWIVATWKEAQSRSTWSGRPPAGWIEPLLGDTPPSAASEDAPQDMPEGPLARGSVPLISTTESDIPEVSRKVKSRPRHRRRDRPRSKTIALKRLTRDELRRGALANPPVEGVERPTTRAECSDGPRPCPWVACKHHLYLDINPRTGSIKINFPDLEPWEMQHTCALDVADNGGLTLEEIGLITNLTRERVRQVEVRGLLTLKARSARLR